MGSQRSARIIGVGQAFAGDDGVGREVASRLREVGVDAAIVDGGSGLLNLLIDATSKVFVVDAVVGGGVPGSLRILSVDDLDRGPRPVSSHGLTVEHAIALARRFSPKLDICIVGIAIEEPRQSHQGLSPDVAASVPNAVDWLVDSCGAVGDE
jgi:hydrogenase maturation protease